MKVISWNTNGLRATLRDDMFFPLFKKEKPDILCIQETKCDPSQLPSEAVNIAGYYSYFATSTYKKGYSGVATYTKEKPLKVEYGLGIPRFDEQGRTLVTHFKDFILINCYFPNGGGAPEKLQYKLDFYDAFLKFATALAKKKPVLVTGDVNVAHEEIDLARPKENKTHVGFLPVERAWLDEFLASGFTDVFRHFYPTQKDAYTYWDTLTHARERNVGWRIDYFLASNKLMSKVKGTKILTDWYGSDHCPISIELK
jgi:exodeoxyribonuclease III